MSAGDETIAGHGMPSAWRVTLIQATPAPPPPPPPPNPGEAERRRGDANRWTARLRSLIGADSIDVLICTHTCLSIGQTRGVGRKLMKVLAESLERCDATLSCGGVGRIDRCAACGAARCAAKNERKRVAAEFAWAIKAHAAGWRPPTGWQWPGGITPSGAAAPDESNTSGVTE